uniref:HMA domain-containing protein n=1 Tax=Leersia perrieri TaxID=77586 RepID=A0A0D9WWM3_9ORYZ
MAPIVLGMDVHCDTCAKKIEKIIKKMPGVTQAMAYANTGEVVVQGAIDAAALKARVESKTKKPVAIASAGGVESPSAGDHHHPQTPPPQHAVPWAPPPQQGTSVLQATELS